MPDQEGAEGAPSDVVATEVTSPSAVISALGGSQQFESLVHILSIVFPGIGSILGTLGLPSIMHDAASQMTSHKKGSYRSNILSALAASSKILVLGALFGIFSRLVYAFTNDILDAA